jgi:hypothetical protein
MANENPERCDKCRYFYKVERPQPGGAAAGCRRFPPTSQYLIVPRAKQLAPHIMEPREETRSSFPAVAPDWWCGEWTPAIALTS